MTEEFPARADAKVLDTPTKTNTLRLLADEKVGV
jgi:hypothetical protein